MNFRGCREPNNRARCYHSGDTDDLYRLYLAQLSQLRHVETENPLFFNGSSQKAPFAASSWPMSRSTARNHSVPTSSMSMHRAQSGSSKSTVRSIGKESTPARM
jgi:hypothetical protein